MTDAAELVKLADCPFCGQSKIYLNKPNQHWPHGSINCPSCMVVMPGAVGGSAQESELIAQWNARAAQQDGTREALEHARTRFECLADEFADGGGHTDEVLCAMCQVDAERMDKALNRLEQ